MKNWFSHKANDLSSKTGAYSEPCQTSKMELLAKVFDRVLYKLLKNKD